MTKRVLIVITTEFYPTGGLTTVMMNYYRHMDKSGIQIDFASTNDPPEVLVNELMRNGSRYFNLGRRKKLIHYFRSLYLLCKNYDVIHVNGNSATAAIELLAARLAGVSVRIHHNHNSTTGHPVIHAVLSPIFKRQFTIGIACSENAGDWLFGKGKFLVLRNAIDTTKYQYSAQLREKYRREFDIPQNAFVIGHVGKMNIQKNHKKLLEVFSEYCKSHAEAFLLCVGYSPQKEDIPVRETILAHIKDLELSSRVILTGLRTDIPGFLSAMDAFVFPSRWEGLGLAVIEAQASGLPCLLSDKVPHDVYISTHIQGVLLDASSAEWASMIDKIIVPNREKQSVENISSITKAGYNIEHEADKLRALYLTGT